jgi:hypothetical protein
MPTKPPITRSRILLAHKDAKVSGRVHGSLPKAAKQRNTEIAI